MQAFIRHFWFSLLATAAVCLLTMYFLGIGSAAPLVVLIVIEIVFSFDNAIVNAKVLGRLSAAWQTAFLTIGVVIAIFGMRLLFPLVIVALSAHLGLGEVWRLALHSPHEYAANLQLAHPLIASFGGAFLLLLGLEFFLNGQHEILWWRGVERRLKALKSFWLPTAMAAAIVAALAGLSHHHGGQILRAGLMGVATYVVVQLLTSLLARGQPKGQHVTGWAALSLFLYLQVLDASFSFDGVIGAFAITNMVVLIAAGLGVGALWVRSLTVFMVRRGTLESYRYLEHGAYYTISVLAVALLLSLFISVPDVITGIIGLGIIGAAAATSMQARRHKGPVV